jgi:LmbE family N-acetylglucosaminyl deacetylase
MAIGAHPDDIELGCGGLLLKAARHGHNIFMYTLTRGGASGDPNSRVRELISSAEFIGAKKLWIDDLEDTKLYIVHEIINRIEFFINECEADVIYTHSVSDTHHDHRAVAESTIEAGRYAPNILAYEIPVTKDFKPQVYYDISDVLDDKLKLANLFISQKDKRFIQSNALRGLAEYRALQSRLNSSITAVEAFEVYKIGFRDDFKLLDSKQAGICNHSKDIYPKKEHVIEHVPRVPINRISQI